MEGAKTFLRGTGNYLSFGKLEMVDQIKLVWNLTFVFYGIMESGKQTIW